MIIAYLRISTSKQELKNQRFEIETFAREQGLTIDHWVEEIVSGCKSEHIRLLGSILKQLKCGDKLIVSEISRLSRTLEDIMSIMGTCLKKKVEVYCVKENLKFSNSISSKILTFAFGITAEVERNLISVRTKEALAQRKAEGVILGRPVGSGIKFKKLIKEKETIMKLLEIGLSITKIARKYDVSRPTLYSFLKRIKESVHELPKKND